jgi:hypothetical protein
VRNAALATLAPACLAANSVLRQMARHADLIDAPIFMTRAPPRALVLSRLALRIAKLKVAPWA